MEVPTCRKFPYRIEFRTPMTVQNLVQKLIDITDQAHDDSQFRFSRTVVSALDKYVHCYHVLYRLGLYYHEGWGGHRSLPVGKEYWSQAKGELEKLLKEEEHPLVAFDLGVMWDRGFPYASYEMAFKYYMIASNLNFAKAQYNLALMYAYGEGVPVDHHITTKFYYLASKNELTRIGHSQAHMKAGKDYFVMFTEDKAKRKYLDRALECFERGALLGQEKAQKRLLRILTTGDYIEPMFRRAFKFMPPDDGRHVFIMRLLREKFVWQLECAISSNAFAFDCLPDILQIFKHLVVELFWEADLPHYFKLKIEDGDVDMVSETSALLMDVESR